MKTKKMFEHYVGLFGEKGSMQRYKALKAIVEADGKPEWPKEFGDAPKANPILDQAMKILKDEGLTLEDGVIAGPGKFESEPIETLYYYDAMMNGGGEQLDEGYTVFEPTAEEKEAFSLTEPYFIINVSDQGFVNGHNISDADYNEMLDEIERTMGEEE